MQLSILPLFVLRFGWVGEVCRCGSTFRHNLLIDRINISLHGFVKRNVERITNYLTIEISWSQLNRLFYFQNSISNAVNNWCHKWVDQLRNSPCLQQRRQSQQLPRTFLRTASVWLGLLHQFVRHRSTYTANISAPFLHETCWAGQTSAWLCPGHWWSQDTGHRIRIGGKFGLKMNLNSDATSTPVISNVISIKQNDFETIGDGQGRKSGQRKNVFYMR